MRSKLGDSSVCKIEDKSILKIVGGCWGKVLCLKMVLVSPNVCLLLCAGISDMDHLLPIACPLCLFSLQLYFTFPLNMDNEAEYVVCYR